MKTHLGWRILPGVTYRYTVVSGHTHVDEYRGGSWIAYLGYLIP